MVILRFLRCASLREILHLQGSHTRSVHPSFKSIHIKSKMPPRSREHIHDGPWYSYLFIVLLLQFLGALIFLGLLGFGLIISLAFRCFWACKPFGPEYM